MEKVYKQAVKQEEVTNDNDLNCTKVRGRNKFLKLTATNKAYNNNDDDKITVRP